MLTTIILTAIITLVVAGAAFVIYERRKANPAERVSTSIVACWEQIRPIVLEGITKALEFVQLDKTDFVAVEHYVATNIKALIDDLDILTEQEKALFTVDMIKTIISPILRKIYEQDTQHQ